MWEVKKNFLHGSSNPVILQVQDDETMVTKYEFVLQGTSPVD